MKVQMLFETVSLKFCSDGLSFPNLKHNFHPRVFVLSQSVEVCRVAGPGRAGLVLVPAEDETLRLSRQLDGTRLESTRAR